MSDRIIERTCSTCKTTLLITNFYKCRTGKDGIRSACKSCVNKSNKPASEKWRLAHKPKTCPVYLRQYKYGITQEEFSTLIINQNNRCGICEKETNLVVDHCHTTGKVRGLLCHKCNIALGSFGDTVEGIQKALDYLGKV